MRSEFDLAGFCYRFEGMPAQAETRVLRRLTPLLKLAVPFVVAAGSQLAIRTDVDFVQVVQTALGGWHSLSDDDLDVIERATLSAIVRETDDGWVRVWTKGEPEPAFRDIDGAVMLQLVGRALGLTVKRWMDGSEEALPVELRAVFKNLH